MAERHNHYWDEKLPPGGVTPSATDLTGFALEALYLKHPGWDYRWADVYEVVIGHYHGHHPILLNYTGLWELVDLLVDVAQWGGHYYSPNWLVKFVEDCRY